MPCYPRAAFILLVDGCELDRRKLWKTFTAFPARRSFSLFLALAFLAPVASADSAHPKDSPLSLRSGWMLQSSCEMKTAGEQISSPGFVTTGWHKTDVPSTVLAALVADKSYPDTNIGMNLRSIPGTTYPIGKNFAELPMPKDSPFHCSWWYRTQFLFPGNSASRHAWLHFNGINYRANIWLNGHKLANAHDVAGTYRMYEFDVTPLLVSSEANVLAVEAFAQTETDLGINWQDWNPTPPDKNLGLFSDVFLDESGPIQIQWPEVVTHFPGASLDQANLTAIVELRNAAKREVEAWVEGEIEDIHFRQRVILKPDETRTVKFTPDQYPQLRIRNPKLWWPASVGPQNLHELSLRVMNGNEISDAKSIRFGIREITSELNANGHRVFRVNRKKILIRGGGWAEDMLLRRSRERLEAQLAYVREMNLNTIRLEGQMESDDFYDLADEKGILVMPGWACCTFWQLWPKWKPGDLPIARESLRSQILRLRHHPSAFVWLNGSDVPPPAWVERAYLKVLKESDWPNPELSSASSTPTSLTGKSGMKMKGPYDYVPPSYWLTDPGQYGGAYGFNAESSPGPAIPQLGSLRKMLPAEHLWPIDNFWSFHAALERFSNVDRFNRAMNEMFGAPSGLPDYLNKAQAMAYDGERAMFEAYARNKYNSTGVIQWMLNNAWPSIFWHLFDYYLQPAGGYFGTKKACEPLHVQYSYDDASVVVVNNLYQRFAGLTASAEVYDFNLEKIFSGHEKLDIEEDRVERILTIPSLPAGAASPVYFVRLALQDSTGKLRSSNFYWLSRKPAKIQWKKTVYFDDPPPADPTDEASIYTPASPYDDFKALDELPQVRLSASAAIEPAPGAGIRVKLQNPSNHLAFQIHLAIQRQGDETEILPVLWDDNYFEMMPGETREIVVRFSSRDALNGNLELRVAGWNMEAETFAVAGAGVTE
jgi:exo-1,4-beta-D-glucosaminidase